MPGDSPARRRIRLIALPAVAVRPISRPPLRLRYSDRTFLDQLPPCSQQEGRGGRNDRLATLRAECLLNGCAGEAFSFIWVFALPPLFPRLQAGRIGRGQWRRHRSDRSVMLNSPGTAGVHSALRRRTTSALERIVLVLPVLALVAFFLIIRRPPRDKLFPYPTLFAPFLAPNW